MEVILSCILTAILTVIGGVVLFLIQRFLNEQRKKDIERDEEKAQDNALILRSINALGKLTVANSIALRDGKTNGEMKAALAEYESIQKEMYEYIVLHYAKSVK